MAARAGLPAWLCAEKEYATAFAASIDNPNVQYVLNRHPLCRAGNLRRRHGNLIPDSVVYRTAATASGS